ncbi:MAG: S9 family peptidase [bacterium]
MKQIIPFLMLVSACAQVSPAPNTRDVAPIPPSAAKTEHIVTAHGESWVDPYFWLRERSNPEVLKYLQLENQFADAVTAHLTQDRETLFDEMVGRINEDDTSPPFQKGGYRYFDETKAGKDYEIHHRVALDGSNPQVILDENLEASGHEYFSLGVMEVSPNDRWLAYSVDRTGSERFQMRFRDLSTGMDVKETVDDTYYSAAWSSDSSALYYTRVDAANRPYQIWRHRLGSADDELVFEEKDESFHLSVQASRSGELVFIQLQSAVTTEYWVVDRATSKPEVVVPRVAGVEYYIDQSGPYLYMLTNRDAQNFQLLRTRADDRKTWESVIPHSASITLENINGFKDFIVVEERRGGVTTLRVKWHDGTDKFIPFPEPSYTTGLRDNYVWDTKAVRYRYSSLVTPRSTFDYDVSTGETKLIKQDEVKGYDPANYRSERVFATAQDGTKIPISYVYKEGALSSGPAPLYLTGYGAYGISYDPYFSSSRVSLLDRGVVFAIAHIRGGSDMGRAWYEDGKLLKKKNTFNDFIACAEALQELQLTTRDKLAISGGSAGGLLIGAVINSRPELFKVAVADVPFVDVLNTMSDPSLPLTVIEWEEWGNPADKDYFDYIRSYSPYDNVASQRYPSLLVTAGLNDPRVQYWEPAKWVAKLRATADGANPILLKTNMGAGHGGASGRYGYLRETAFEYAFVLDQLNGPTSQR